jgi:hypothetical protein
VYEGDIIDMICKIGEQGANPLSALPVLLKLPPWFDDPPLVFVPTSPKRFDRDHLVVTPLHGGLVVEGVDMTRSTIHEQKDDVFRFGGKVRLWQVLAVVSLGVPKKTIA